MNFLKAWWPTILHIIAAAVVILTPSVKALAGQYPAESAVILLIWAEIVHWTTDSPTTVMAKLRAAQLNKPLKGPGY